MVSADVSLEHKNAVVNADHALSEEKVTNAIKAEDYAVMSFEVVSAPKKPSPSRLTG